MTALDLAQDMPMRDSSGSSVAEVLRENGKPLLNFLHFIQAFNFGALRACTCFRFHDYCINPYIKVTGFLLVC